MKIWLKNATLYDITLRGYYVCYVMIITVIEKKLDWRKFSNT